MTFDILGTPLSLDAQRKQNALEILELGKQYIQHRESAGKPDTPGRIRTGECTETLSRVGMDEGIRHVQDDKSTRLKDTLRFIRVVRVSDDIVDVHAI